MADVQVILVDQTGTREVETNLPSDKPIGELLALMATQLGVDCEPDPMIPWHRVIRWRAENPETGQPLTGSATLEAAGVKPRDRLRLSHEVATEFSPVESAELWDGRSFSDVATIITVVYGERLIALAVPHRETVTELGEYLRLRLAMLSPPINLPSSFRLLHEGRGDFLKEEGLVAEMIGDQDVVSLHEVIKIKEL